MIILLCSPLPQMGKDTVGEILINELDYKRIAFADRVKEVAKIGFSWNGEKDKRGRELLINIGMSGREYNENIWVNYVIDRINENPKINYVITDCRFQNECNLMKKYFDDVYVIGIESEIYGDKRFAEDTSQKQYYDIKKDFIVNNNSTSKNKLKSDILEIMRNIFTLQNT